MLSTAPLSQHALSLVLVLALALALVGNNDASEVAPPPKRALLALHRSIDGDLVAGRNTTVTYTVHNVGQSTATNVALRDPSFPASRFAVFSGAFKQALEALGPGANVSAAVQMQPRRAGMLIVGAASVAYSDGEGAQRVTRLASGDTISVEDLLAFRRRTDRHRSEWAGFGAAFAVLVVAPLAVSAAVVRGVPADGGGRKKN